MKFNVEKRIITSQPEQIISYAVDYTAEFEFDEEWTDKVITARFVKNGAYIDVVLENNKCMIPLFSYGSVYVGCFTDSFASTYIKMDVDGSVKDLGNIPAIPPDADAYNQLIRMIESGMLKGEPGEPGKPGKDGEPGKDYIITEEDYQQIAEIVEAEIEPKLTELKSEVDSKADAEELAKTDRELQALKDLTRGAAWSVVEQISEDYEKPVPSGCYKAEVQSIEGNSVVWNQYVSDSTSGTYGTGGSMLYQHGHNHRVVADGEHGGYANINGHIHSRVEGHYYAVLLDRDLTGTGAHLIPNQLGGGRKYNSFIGRCQSSGDYQYISVATTKACEVEFSVYVFDLTKMFGTGNEPTSVDDPRIRWIERYANEHPEYNTGEIISTQLSEVVVRGKNLVDYSVFQNPNNWTSLENNRRVLPIEGLEVGKTYHISANDDVGGKEHYLYVAKYQDGVNVGNAALVYQNNYANPQYHYFTVESGYDYVFWMWSKSGLAGLLDDIKWVQLEIGTTPTPYTPYSEEHIPFNVDLKSAGTVRDKWHDGDVDRKAYTLEINETDNIALSDQNDTYERFVVRGKNAPLSTTSRNVTGNYYSGIRIGKELTSSITKEPILDIRDTFIVLCLPQAEFGSTLESLKSKLREKPMRFCYELATPTQSEAPTLDQLFTEPNGSITFEDANKLAVKSTIEYAQNNAEV